MTERGDHHEPIGPFATAAAARAAAHRIIPPDDDRSILSEDQNQQLLDRVCDAAGVDPGVYDTRVLGWIAGYEDSLCGSVAGMILRAHAAGRREGKS